jgi:hypothetical protein
MSWRNVSICEYVLGLLCKEFSAVSVVRLLDSAQAVFFFVSFLIRMMLLCWQPSVAENAAMKGKSRRMDGPRLE